MNHAGTNGHDVRASVINVSAEVHRGDASVFVQIITFKNIRSKTAVP
jgi:hypothetical protein